MNLSEAILDLLFPPKCPFCRDILADPRAPLCPGCQPKLPWLEGNRAEGKVDFADGCFSSLAYRGAVPDGVHRYKFGRNRACGVPFATLMAPGGELQGLSGISQVIPRRPCRRTGALSMWGRIGFAVATATYFARGSKVGKAPLGVCGDFGITPRPAT